MSMRRDAAIAAPAARQDGATSRTQLRAAGLTDRQIDGCIGGVLISAHRGVYRHAAAPDTVRTRVRAAVLACGPTAVASHRTAAMLHGFDGIRRFHPEVLVKGRGIPRVRGVLVHRTNWLPAADHCVVDGMPATSPARTALDLGAVLPFEVVERAVQSAVIDGRLTFHDLLAVLDRSARSGRNGSGVLRAVVEQSVPDSRIESMLEHRILELIRRAGLPSPTLQYELVCSDGRLVRLDTAWPDMRLSIEGDGHRWHATRAQLARDLARRRSIVASGWEHYAYGWDDVHPDPSRVLVELARLLPRFASR